MGRLRKSKIGPIEIVVVGVIAVIAAVPKETWILIGVIAVIVFIVFFAFKWSRTSGESDLDVSPARSSRNRMQSLTNRYADEPVSVRKARGDEEFEMPSSQICRMG